MKFDKEFKEAISQLSCVEKDKLILRLLKKDLTLANRLAFELLDNKTVDERRQIIENRILAKLKRMTEYEQTPGHLMMDLRDLSGEITEHVKVTKDKFGEVSLNITMLSTALDYKNREVLTHTRGKARKFCIYVIARAFKILVLRSKLHEDTWLDLDKGLQRLGKLIGENDYLMKTAIQNGFDVNWLITLEIPENIEQIHKQIRVDGYLTSRVYINSQSYEN